MSVADPVAVTLRDLIRHRPWRTWILASLLSRLPQAMLPLLWVLVAQQLTGSLTVGAVLGGLCALSTCVCSPSRGRLLDRTELRRAIQLDGTFSVILFGLVWLALYRDLPTWTLMILAILQGWPNAGIMAGLRALLVVVVPSEQIRRAHFVESLMMEVSFTVGPFVVGTVALVAGVPAAVGAVAVVQSLAVVSLFRVGLLRPSPLPQAKMLGDRVIRRLVYLMVALVMGFGLLESNVAQRERSHPWGGLFADSHDELRAAVRQLHRNGADAIKIWATGGGIWPGDREHHQHFEQTELELVVREAQTLGMQVLAHCENDQGALAAVRAGVLSVEHGEELHPATLEEMVARGTYLVPTLELFRGEWFGMDAHDGGGHSRKESAERNFETVLTSGVQVAVGSDAVSSAPVPFGHITLAEIRSLAQLGMPGADVLQAATSVGARLLGLDHLVGSLQQGKRADIVGLSVNPVEETTAITPNTVTMVVRDGEIWKDVRERSRQ